MSAAALRLGRQVGICVQAGRAANGRLGYVGIDGALPADGRFHPWPRNTAVDARCIDRPAQGGVALMVVERVARSRRELTASGACTAAEVTRCPAHDTTTLDGLLSADCPSGLRVGAR